MTNVPGIYRVFFAYIEPIVALAGAFYTFKLVHPSFLHSDQSKVVMPTMLKVTLYRQVIQYVASATCQHLTLRTTTSRRLWWERVLLGLVIDMGCVLTMIPVALERPENRDQSLWVQLTIFWSIGSWDETWWGGVGFLYVSIFMKLVFLVTGGLPPAVKKEKFEKGE